MNARTVMPRRARVATLAALALAGGCRARDAERVGSPGVPASVVSRLAHLPAATVDVDSARRTVVIELPAATLTASPPGRAMAMVLLPVYRAEIPVDGFFFAARIELRDGAGHRLPQSLLHHFNLSDPERRELFLPIELHIMAASKETPSLAVPGWLFGLPFRRGQEFITSAMLGNVSSMAYPIVRVRLVLRYEPPSRWWPVFRAYPWVMDVMFPLGTGPTESKAFDLPPGWSERSFEGSPAIPGTIVGVGGHIHDYGVQLTLTDVTTGQVLWRAHPLRDPTGHVTSLPVSLLYGWRGLGLHITPDHRYRATVMYDNPTGHTIRAGGMGAVAGLLIPDRASHWPMVDPDDSLYRRDLAATLRLGAEPGEQMMMDMAH